MKPPKGSKLLRKGRASIKSSHYLISTTVVDRRPAFKYSPAAEIVLNSLHWLENRRRIVLDAAVVMPDHVHFVAGLEQGALAQVMHSLKSYPAKKINSIIQKEGSFWQPQYHDHAVRKDEDLREVVLYTLQNPVRAGLVEDFHAYPHWYCRWDV
jgi:REP element-mobilizing transposase RayT